MGAGGDGGVNRIIAVAVESRAVKPCVVNPCVVKSGVVKPCVVNPCVVKPCVVKPRVEPRPWSNQVAHGGTGGQTGRRDWP